MSENKEKIVSLDTDKKSTSFNVDPALVKQVRKIALDRDTTATAAVDWGLRRWLEHMAGASEPNPEPEIDYDNQPYPTDPVVQFVADLIASGPTDPADPKFIFLKGIRMFHQSNIEIQEKRKAAAEKKGKKA